MPNLRVLITNCCLDGRTGTEMYVHDLAIWLRRQGHTPIAFSPRLGRLAERLAYRSVPVVSELDRIAQAPDIIHGHHTLETMEALLHFPGAPAIFVCHDFDAWHDTPPDFPRIRRFVAVDQTCAERLTLTHGIDPQRVMTMGNPVDLALFKPRSPLPDLPRRAVVFSGYGTYHSIQPIREACDDCGIELDVIGHEFGNQSETPQEILPQYDLVFAKGRCAREAIAVGCAVIYCDTFGLGAMFTRNNVQEMNASGRRAMSRPLDKDMLVEEIRRYDANDAALVSRYVREMNSPECIYNQLVDLYDRVIDEHRCDPAVAVHDELRATAAFIRQWSAIQQRLLIRQARPNWLRRTLRRSWRSMTKRMYRTPGAGDWMYRIRRLLGRLKPRSKAAADPA